MSKNNMSNDFKPTRKEINAINHYWEVALAQTKASKNRKQRRNKKFKR